MSFGLCVQAQDTKKWLVIKRRHSVEFCLLIRGSYQTSYLPLIIPKLHPEERAILRHLMTLKKIPYANFVIQELHLEHYNSNDNRGFHQLRNNRDVITQLLDNSPYLEASLWTWPKGSKDNLQDDNFETAKREFEEEILSPLPPSINRISKSFVSKKTYYQRELHEHIWTYIIANEFPLSQQQTNEVVERRWVDSEFVAQHIQ